MRNLLSAAAIAQAEVDMIQFDKVACDELQPLVQLFRQQYPTLKLAVSGRITLDKVQTYAHTKADLLVKSYPYFDKPADIGVKMLNFKSHKSLNIIKPNPEKPGLLPSDPGFSI